MYYLAFYRQIYVSNDANPGKPDAVRAVWSPHRLALTANIHVNNICKELFRDTWKIICVLFCKYKHLNEFWGNNLIFLCLWTIEIKKPHCGINAKFLNLQNTNTHWHTHTHTHIHTHTYIYIYIYCNRMAFLVEQRAMFISTADRTNHQCIQNTTKNLRIIFCTKICSYTLSSSGS